MKTTLYLSVLFAFLLLAGWSCTKEEDKPDPSIEFKTGEFQPGINFISNDTILVVDTEFTFGIVAIITNYQNNPKRNPINSQTTLR